MNICLLLVVILRPRLEYKWKKQTTFCQQIRFDSHWVYICLVEQIQQRESKSTREVARVIDKDRKNTQLIVKFIKCPSSKKFKMNIKEIIAIIGFGLIVCFISMAQAGGDKSARTTVSVKWSYSKKFYLSIVEKRTNNESNHTKYSIHAGYHIGRRWRKTFRRLSCK